MEGAMEDARAVRHGQRAWALENAVPFDSRGYVDDVEMNLRTPLSAEAREAFEKGIISDFNSPSGSLLTRGPGERYSCHWSALQLLNNSRSLWPNTAMKRSNAPAR